MKPLRCRRSRMAAGQATPTQPTPIWWGRLAASAAAQALNGVLQHPERLGDPVSLTVNFCAALAEGPFTVMARAARTNRSTQHWTIEIQQGDAIVVTGTAVTAVRRESLGVDEETHALCPPPAEVPPPQVMAPMEFVKRYEQLPVTGQLPVVWDGSGHSSLTQISVRDEPASPPGLCVAGLHRPMFSPGCSSAGPPTCLWAPCH